MMTFSTFVLFLGIFLFIDEEGRPILAITAFICFLCYGGPF